MSREMFPPVIHVTQEQPANDDPYLVVQPSTSRIAVSEVDALNDWNRRDGLLPALRAVRDCCTKWLRAEPASRDKGLWATVFDGWDDAMLLKVAGVKGGDANSGDRRSNSPDMNEAGADVNAPSAGGVPEKTGPTPASSDMCMWCGKTLAGHAEFPNSLVPRMPCLGLRVGFRAKQAAEPSERDRIGDPIEFGRSERNPLVDLINDWRKDTRREALLDAARELREMAQSFPRDYETILECADRLEARAKDTGETGSVPDDGTPGAPSEPDIAYNRGLIYAVQVARSARLNEETAPGTVSNAYQLGWDGACNRIAANIEEKVKL